MGKQPELNAPSGVGVDAVVRRNDKDPWRPRALASINPLRSPISPGNRILAGGELFLCDTDMRGNWKIYKNHGEDGTIRWKVEAENIDGQIGLIYWFERHFATFIDGA